MKASVAKQGLFIILYKIDDTNVCVSVFFKDETFWLTQKAMAELFAVNVPAISKHLQNIFDEGELEKAATVSKMEIVQFEGNRKVKRSPEFYSLDAIIAVDYRVSSKKATKFRQWATRAFYAFVQNKLHFAVTGQTAAELIYDRADAEKPTMGLTTWKDAPDGKILKRDIGVAKNYLNEKEMSRLNRLVTIFVTTSAAILSCHSATSDFRLFLFHTA